MFKDVKQHETIQNEAQREQDKTIHRASVSYGTVIKQSNLTCN